MLPPCIGGFMTFLFESEKINPFQRFGTFPVTAGSIATA
jgi:drug/metabolite transporter (DMT)-like permease